MQELRRKPRWRPGLGPTVGLLIVGMVLVTAGATLAITTYGARSSALAVSEDLIRQVSRRTQDRVESFLDVPRDALALGQRQADAGVLDLEDLTAAEAWFFDFMSVYESVGAVNYGDREGNFLMVKRMPDGALSTKRVLRDPELPGGRETTWRRRTPGAELDEVYRVDHDPDDTYDPRLRPWYVGAEAARGLFWTRVYVFWSDKQPGITASLPVREAGELDIQGVLSLDISLADFSQFLAGLQVSDHGRAIVLDTQRRVVAGVRLDPDDAEAAELPSLAGSGVAEIEALSALPEVDRALERGREQPLHFAVGGEPWIGVLSPIRVATGNNWVIGVLAPESDFLASLERSASQSRAALLVCVGLALLLSGVLTRWLTRSLRVLVVETQAVRDLELDQSPVLDAPFREIGEVLEAFEGMKTGLRSFQKYVPIKLVRKLLEEKKEPELGGEALTLTLYFSDIANFTPISERLGAMAMAIHLGAYHSAMTRAIQDREGTVVQYVGDEIMAFWGAPSPVGDHAGAACAAALAAQEIVDTLWADEPEIPRFETRIGLHTATVAVGHFGSEERLYYGAIGDGVNLCSRLEGINKHYGTRIIASEVTRAAAGDRYVWRRLDRVAVKGKLEPTEIFELLGPAGGVPVGRIDAARCYEQGLEHYLERRWPQAVERFRAALSLRPEDRAAELMIERCEAFGEQPPPEHWDGVFAMQHK